MTTRARKERRRLPNFGVGLIAILVVIAGLFLAFTKRIPFTDRGYELTVMVRNAQNLAEKSPVRIAGVNVGEVTKVEPVPESGAAEITMTILEQGRPIKEDVRIQIRPRLFLEGNLFIDVRPGSPSAPELEDGAAIPIQQTYNSVQLDEVLSTLQADVRGNLQLLLKELGDGFQRYGGAEGLRQFNLTGGPAYKNTALVNEAFLGTEPGDLAGLVENFDRVFIALNRNQTQLQDLVTNLRIVTGSFAAEDSALQDSIRQLPGVLDAAQPVFANLNSSFPPLRAFAREALPGVRSSGPTIDAALPFVRQLRALVSASELRGLTADLRPTIPQLAKLTRRQVPFLEQARALSSCFTNVIIPWANDEVGDGDTDGAGDVINPNYQETGYGLVGIGGESRSGDANGQYIRVGAGGGTNTVLSTTTGVGVTAFPIEGSEPAFGPKTPFRPEVPCETQETPDLRTETGPAPAQRTGSGQTIFQSAPDSRQAEISREAVQLYSKLAVAGSAAEAVDSRSERRRYLGEYGDLLARLQQFGEEDLPEFERLQRGLGG